mgnify:CR=1 FL=1
MTWHLILLSSVTAIAAGCAKEPPPRSVDEFIGNPIMLEAAMVRCGQNRAGHRYDPECINARQAVARIQVKEEAERAKALEASSERKRKALRRTQRAAAEARRRAAAAERARKEAEYLAQFGVPMPVDSAEQGVSAEPVAPLSVEGAAQGTIVPEVTGSNAPVAEAVPEDTPAEPESPPPSDLAAIREELRKRGEPDGD